MTEKRWPVRFVLLGCIAIVVMLQGCSNREDKYGVESTYLSIPRVTGMLFTAWDGTPTGTWGNMPQWQYSDGSQIHLSTYAYPNPFQGRTNLVYSLPVKARVQIWITRALGPNETQDNLVDYFGGEFVTPPGRPLWRYVDSVGPGEYTVIINTETWPEGFYCCYVQTDHSYEPLFIVKGVLPDNMLQ